MGENQMGDVATWVGSITALVTAIIGGAYAVLRWLRPKQDSRPKLVLGFDQQRDVKSQRNTVGLPSTVLSRWLRVRVENTPGRQAAKGCRAYLVRVSRPEPGGRLEELLVEDARPMQWMHDRPEVFGARDILAGVPHWIDVAHTADHVNGLMASVHPAWSIEEPGGTYLFTVMVVAEDSDPETIRLRVTWDGSWESLTGEVMT
jgi:hypothetical protein